MKFKKIINYLDDLIDGNFFVFSIFLILIGIIRNGLELIFYSKTRQAFGFSMTVSGLLNTILYVFLMVITEGYLINLLLKGNKKQLRFLLQKGSQLLLGLFILIPILNNVFNYYLFNLPVFYDLKSIHPALFSHYGPMGINIAFLMVLFLFPLWLKRVYGCSFLKALKVVLMVYISHYIITYQIWLSFSLGGYFSRYNPFLEIIHPMNMYTIGFVLIILFVYPFFLEDYPKNKTEFFQASIAYFLLWGVLFFLFFFNPFLSPNWIKTGNF